MPQTLKLKIATEPRVGGFRLNYETFVEELQHRPDTTEYWWTNSMKILHYLHG
jgi:hypothetical protein